MAAAGGEAVAQAARLPARHLPPPPQQDLHRQHRLASSLRRWLPPPPRSAVSVSRHRHRPRRDRDMLDPGPRGQPPPPRLPRRPRHRRPTLRLGCSLDPPGTFSEPSCRHQAGPPPQLHARAGAPVGIGPARRRDHRHHSARRHTSTAPPLNQTTAGPTPSPLPRTSPPHLSRTSIRALSAPFRSSRDHPEISRD